MKFWVSSIVLFFSFNLQAQEIGEKVFSSTVKINTARNVLINGKQTKEYVSGTGFYFELGFGKDTVRFIVTNKHVIENANLGILKFNFRKDSTIDYGNTITFEIQNFEAFFIKHPSEDLAIIPIGAFERQSFIKFKKGLGNISYQEKNILDSVKEQELNAIEDVFMIGYPKGFYDSSNNIPVLRKGITATPAYMDFNKRKQFLLDIPTYNGSSGSPVFIWSSSHIGKKGGLEVRPRFYFLGIATESKEYAANGNVVSKEKDVEMTSKVWLPFNIATVIKARVLLDFKYIFAPFLKDKKYLELYFSTIANAKIY